MKVILVEVEVKEEIEQLNWTATGGGSYYTTYKFSERGEVIGVRENGSIYTKVNSVSQCDSTASSFYQDIVNDRLYIHTSTGESPSTKLQDGSYKFIIIAYFLICFSSYQSFEKILSFTPEWGSVEVFYLPYLSEDLPHYEESVGDFYIGDIRTTWGRISFVNDGWWYNALNQFIFHNVRALIKVGELGENYANYVKIFDGVLQSPEVSDEKVVFQLKDLRDVKLLKKIPVQRFDKTTYQNLENRAEGLPIPLTFGEVKNLIPVCIDTENKKFKFSQGANEAIVKVFVDGVETTAYTADLTNGEFTLDVPNLANKKVSCWVKGVKCSPSGTYSENVADILLYVLKNQLGFSDAELDLNSFNVLRTTRTQKIAWYLNKETDAIDFIRLLQNSCLFQLVRTQEGKIGVRVYKSDDSAEVEIKNDEIVDLELNYDAEGVYQKVCIKYGYDFEKNNFLRYEKVSDKVLYRYSEGKTLEVETALWDVVEVEGLAQKYLSMSSKIRKFIKARVINEGLFSKSAGVKSNIEYKINNSDIFTQEAYRLLSIKKDLSSNLIEIKALEDAVAIGVIHLDVPHSDYHEDFHLDTPHNDTPHSDSSHEDVPHLDYHEDTHSDVSHNDEPHTDFHFDHLDEAYHEDSYEDITHEDSPHEDSHTDTHEDISHLDSTHSDVAHQDVPHQDYHEDYHEDVPHSDSNY